MPKGRGNPPLAQGPGRVSLGPGADLVANDLRSQRRSLVALIDANKAEQAKLFAHTTSITKLLRGSVPAGATGSVQYNNSGVLGGDTTFVWDTTNGRLGIGLATPLFKLDILTPSGSPSDPAVRVGVSAAQPQSISLYNGFGTYQFFNCAANDDFMPGTVAGDGGLRGNTTKIFWIGDSGSYRVKIDSGGNLTVLTDIKPLGTYRSADGSAGITATIVTAALTLAGTQGSMTFKNGILTAQTPAT